MELEDDIEEVQQRHKDRAVKQGGRRFEEKRQKIINVRREKRKCAANGEKKRRYMSLIYI